MASPGQFWVEVIGIAAALLTTTSFLPQALRIWRNRSARDVSLTMYLMMFAGQILWLAYGVVIGSVSLILANSTALMLVGSVLLLKLRDRAPSAAL
ncbi:MAG: SemiSWEET family sugar transporter [Rhodospirillaceae bacterium]|nr:SemiSWEET family sugar transporter [Rhodospirillaceae bacterium]